MSITVISANPRLSIWLSFMFVFPFNCLFNVFPCIFCFMRPQYLVSFIWKQSYNNSLCPILDTSAFFLLSFIAGLCDFHFISTFHLIIHHILCFNSEYYFLFDCLIKNLCIFLNIYFLLNSLIHGLSIDMALSDTKVKSENPHKYLISPDIQYGCRHWEY